MNPEVYKALRHPHPEELSEVGNIIDDAACRGKFDVDIDKSKFKENEYELLVNAGYKLTDNGDSVNVSWDF